MRRYAALFACVFALSVALDACAPESLPPSGLEDGITVTYATVPLSKSKPQETRVGSMIYRGGLDLSSPDPRFGGWSGLIVSADGRRMLAQSDEAHWLRANLLYDARGNLAGIAEAQLADMLDMNGKTMAKAEGDAEGLAALTQAGPDGPVAVSFEGDHRVWRYDLSHSLNVKPDAVPMPKAIKSLRYNEGLEGLAVLKPDTLIAVSENTPDANGDMEAWLVPYPAVPPVAYGQLGVIPHPPYQISDAAMGPDGRYLYLLERHYFGLLGGLAIAVRRIPAADVEAGARLDGEEVEEFDSSETIDNMEGLALRRETGGRTFLYMISDDNYDRAFQRTLLLMFEVAQ